MTKMKSSQEILSEILKKNIHDLDKSEIKNFIKNCDEKYYKKIAKEILKQLNIKKNIEKQIKFHKEILTSLYLSESLVNENLYSKIDNKGFIPNVSDCYQFNYLSKKIIKTTITENSQSENCKYFQSEEEAIKYKLFIEKLKVGVKFKINDLEKWNDGTFNENAKMFYGIQERKREYNFDNFKIWTIVKTGYFENCSPMPLTECNCKNDNGDDIIDWEIPRYMYDNITFIEN